MAPSPHTSLPLTSNWTFKRGGIDSRSEYLPANNLPTEVHRDLLKNGEIANPFLDLNELSVHWIADETWTYHTKFSTPPTHGKPDTISELNFKGLDTFASVYLNGKLIVSSDDMFVEHRIDVTNMLNAGSDAKNILEIVFESARKKGLALVNEHKEHQWIVHQTEVSRGPVRKAQYHWGWDWGPILLTAGPWKPVLLETFVARIEDVWVEYELTDDLKNARCKCFAKVKGESVDVSFEIKNKAEESVAKLKGKALENVFESSIDFPVDLWWPRSYGSQPLYTITATLSLSSSSENAVHQVSKKVGFRKVQLIQEKDDHGTSFYFRINNVDIFAGGSCWIPADSFVSQVTSEAYRNWIKLAVEGNQTMIRVWGGGIYEADAFYEACDELGILVWQDFMFACANYPAHPEYLESVELEARQNARRLRDHPSIVIWAGNNEDYQIVERYGLEYRFEEDKDPQSWLKTNFPARYIYEYLLPKVVREETKGVPYHPSSPFGNGTSTTLKVDPTVGDIHQWNVWHGDMKPYQLLPTMGGRFVSEFGMEAYPHLETLEKSITRQEDRYPGSMSMDFRNKAIGHERRLVSYVAENFRIRYDLPSFTHLTQIMQADTMAWAYKSWRRQWGSTANRQCGGVLVWQLNDCWPTMSWAVIDYYLVPKPAYYAIKRAMSPIAVGVTRKFHHWTMRPADELWKRDTSHINMRQLWEDVVFDVWIASSNAEKVSGKLNVKFISVRTGDEVHPSLARDVMVDANGTTEVIQNCKVENTTTHGTDAPFLPSQADPFVIHASFTVDRQEVATDVSWPDPIKYLDLSERGVDVECSNDGSSIVISARKPVKGFVIAEKQGVKLGDNGFDVMPGERKKVVVEGSRADALEWSWVEK